VLGSASLNDATVSMPLVELRPDGFDLDLRYATADNLAGRPIYRRAAGFLHPDAASALGRAAAIAEAQGWRLRVYDAYRPVAAQWALWHALPDPRYVADPREGSSHNRGVAVDLTLADRDGVPLDMGTGFDAMTVLSSHGSTAVPVEAQRHRAMLAGIMAIAGWTLYPHEWWHYQLPHAEGYPVIEGEADRTGL
jgi:zinc D-Ala-D-Ala dipeptidase